MWPSYPEYHVLRQYLEHIHAVHSLQMMKLRPLFSPWKMSQFREYTKLFLRFKDVVTSFSVAIRIHIKNIFHYHQSINHTSASALRWRPIPRFDFTLGFRITVVELLPSPDASTSSTLALFFWTRTLLAFSSARSLLPRTSLTQHEQN